MRKSDSSALVTDTTHTTPDNSISLLEMETVCFRDFLAECLISGRVIWIRFPCPGLPTRRHNEGGDEDNDSYRHNPLYFQPGDSFYISNVKISHYHTAASSFPSSLVSST